MLYSKIHQYIYIFLHFIFTHFLTNYGKLYLQQLNKYNANIALKYANTQ